MRIEGGEGGERREWGWGERGEIERIEKWADGKRVERVRVEEGGMGETGKYD